MYYYRKLCYNFIRSFNRDSSVEPVILFKNYEKPERFETRPDIRLLARNDIVPPLTWIIILQFASNLHLNNT
jgi:hypothetical protein